MLCKTTKILVAACLEITRPEDITTTTTKDQITIIITAEDIIIVITTTIPIIITTIIEITEVVIEEGFTATRTGIYISLASS